MVVGLADGWLEWMDASERAAWGTGAATVGPPGIWIWTPDRSILDDKDSSIRKISSSLTAYSNETKEYGLDFPF